MDTRRWWLGVVAVACFASCGGKELKIVGSMDGDAGGDNESGSGGSSAQSPLECDGEIIEGGAHCTSCSDAVKNGSESDVDCGGTFCEPCGIRQVCGALDDCQSGVCYADEHDNRCFAEHCTNFAQDGGETDEDCGGSECGRCEPGRDCNDHEDCATWTCDEGACRTQCVTDDQCGRGGTCEDQQCVYCMKDADCCEDNACICKNRHCFQRGEVTEPEPGGSVFHESATEVKSLTADAATLYWVEYGKRDGLGNYQNDGRLLARDFDSEEVRVLADDLEGPIGVAVTTEQAFVYLDQVQVTGRRNALARLPLGGGEHELVMLDVAPDGTAEGGTPCPHCLVHDGADAYFYANDGVYMLTPEASEPNLFLDFRPYTFTIGAGTFYLSENDGVWQIPPGSDSMELVWADPTMQLQATADYLYALDTFSGLYLVRMPIEGGPWVRLPPHHQGSGRQLQLVDDLFFHNLQDGSGPWQIMQGTLADTASVQVVVELPLKPPPVWVGTHAGVFWADGGKQIRTAPLAVE